jgi:hypothetical protein
MKKYLIVMALFLPTFVLFAQSRDDVTIYLSPVTGGTPEQQSFFNDNFRMELVGANYTVVDDQRQGDYSMNLSVTQEIEDGYGDVAEEIINVLNISLLDNKDGREILQFSWAFDSLEEMYEWNLHLIYQAMANVPLTKLTAVPDTNHWRNKWIYIAAYGGMELQFGFYDSDDPNRSRTPTFNMPAYFGLGLEFQFLNFMSAEVALMGGPFAVEAGYSSLVFNLPILLKFPLKPSKHFMLEPYGGIQFNASSEYAIEPALMSWVGGFQYGIRGGEYGAITIDVRAMGDLNGRTKLHPTFVPYLGHPGFDSIKGFQLSFLIGYKIGFYNRNKDDEGAAPASSAGSTTDSYDYGDYSY